MVCNKSKEDRFHLSCHAVSFLKKTVEKKQDLLSLQSQIEDKQIYKTVKILENQVDKGEVCIPVDFCIYCFQKLNQDYAERNVASTGIGLLGCFLIDYIFTHRDLSVASRQLYDTKGKRGVYRQNEWYNHAVARLFDLSAKKYKQKIIKNKVDIGQKKQDTLEYE